MGDNTGTSKTSGLLARIQALQSQEAAKDEAAANIFAEENVSPSTESPVDKLPSDESNENIYINPFETESFSFIDNNISDFSENQDQAFNELENNLSFEIDVPESSVTDDDFDFDSAEPVPAVTNDDFSFDSSEPVPSVTNDDFDFASSEPVPAVTNDDFSFDSTEPVPAVTNDDFNFDSSEPVPSVTNDDFNFDSTEPVPSVTNDDFDFASSEPVPAVTNDDFDFDSSEPVPSVTNDDFDFDSSEPVPAVTNDDFDFDSTEPVPAVTDDDDFNFDDEPDFSSAGVSQGLSFTGLYDKETIMGESSDQTEEIRKKTKVPVIICIICAFICLIATTLILFVIPSRYNLIKKTIKVDDDTVMIESTPTLDKTTPGNDEYKKLTEQSNVPPAKENTIIVVVKAEDVIPIPPAQNKKNLKDEVYKIKWGDTLWDIANTYYRSPWKYKKIASYNKISNPDYIISGTTITIPAE